MQNALLVAGFGVVGVMMRYAIGLIVSKYFQPNIPFATFGINMVGAFCIGVIYSLGTEQGQISPDLRIGLVVGLLGGFTTFSAYCVESIALLEHGELLGAAMYFVGTPVLGLLSCLAGISFARFLA